MLIKIYFYEMDGYFFATKVALELQFQSQTAFPFL